MSRPRTLSPPFFAWPTDQQPSTDELVTEFYRQVAIPATRVIAGQFKGRTWDAEEVVDEAFLRLGRAIASGLSIGSPTAWIVAVARNLMLDRIRKDLAYAEFLEKHAALTAPAPDTPAIEEILFDRERVTRLRRAIARLTQPERVCLMARARGLKLREIGPLVGMDLRRAAEMLQRIIEHLREEVRG
jgi:RNA polymerase sigma-70 factor (ECF subfamily)